MPSKKAYLTSETALPFENTPTNISLQPEPQRRFRGEPRPLRGALRLLESMGHAALTEFPLKSGRRADIFSLDDKGGVWIVEVKSGIPDYRSDRKWQDYLEWCEKFFFAVTPEFPSEILPQDAGLIIADGYEAMLLREPVAAPLTAARRKALTLRFAHIAARRLSGHEDPIFG